MFKENSNLKSNSKIEDLKYKLEIFKKNPDKFVEDLKSHLPNEYDVKSEIWKLLNEVGVSPSDKPLGEKTPYSYYDLNRLKELLKTVTEQKEEAA